VSRHDTNTPSVPEAGRAGGTGTATEQSGSPGTGTGRTQRDGRGHFDVVAACFVAFLLLSNIGATKLIGFNVTSGWHLVFDGGAVLFPFTYILGDVLSEVYGFANARRVILTGFVVQLIASLTFWLIQIAPGDHTYRNQAAYEAVLGQVPRMVAASLLGFLAGQLLNSLVLVRIKRRSGERRVGGPRAAPDYPRGFAVAPVGAQPHLVHLEEDATLGGRGGGAGRISSPSAPREAPIFAVSSYPGNGSSPSGHRGRALGCSVRTNPCRAPPRRMSEPATTPESTKLTNVACARPGTGFPSSTRLTSS